MGLLSKMCGGKDARAPGPQYVDGHPAVQASDLKILAASSGGLNQLDALNPRAVWLHAHKADKGGTSIVFRSSGGLAYTVVIEKRWTAGNILIFKNSVLGTADPRDPSASSASLPYATIKARSVLLRDAQDPSVGATKYKNKEFMRSKRWFGVPNTFTYQGVDYRIRQVAKSWSGKYALIVADDLEKKPLCVFRPAKNLFGDLRGSTEILPIAISTTASPTAHALLQDGQPTKLLDLAIVAELMLQHYTQQSNAASAATAGAGASSAAAAVAGV